MRSFYGMMLVGVLGLTSVASEITPEQSKFFETKIRPVLIKECYGCHSNKSGNARGGLRLDTKELTLIGGSSGPAVVPNDLDESLLYTAILHEDFVMPPKRKLPPAVIADFREWIEMGAPDPRVSKVVEIQATITDEDIDEARANFWAFQPPQVDEPPTVEDQSWSRTAIDPFVLSKLEQSRLQPAEDAEPHKVLRRICF
ncbi:MAG: c-type cytochrome domain-containing protein, partial [Planctomycetota bacterium]